MNCSSMKKLRFLGFFAFVLLSLNSFAQVEYDTTKFVKPADTVVNAVTDPAVNVLDSIKQNTILNSIVSDSSEKTVIIPATPASTDANVESTINVSDSSEVKVDSALNTSDSLVTKIDSNLVETMPKKEAKSQKKESKKFNKYINKWEKSIVKSDMIYERGAYGLSYGRNKFRTKKDVKKYPSTALIAIDLAKTGKYLDGKGEYEKSIAFIDSSLSFFKKEVNPETYYYKRALIEIAEAANTIGKSDKAIKLLRFYDDSLINSIHKESEGKMLRLLNKMVEQLDDTLIVPKKVAIIESDSAISIDQSGNQDSTITENQSQINETVSILIPAGIDSKNDSLEYYRFTNVLLQTEKNLGFYQPAYILLNQSLNYYGRIANKKFKWKNPQTEEKLKEKIKRKELKRREFNLAKLYLLQAKLENESGNCPAADSLFKANKKKRIKKLVGKKSSPYIDNLVSWAVLKTFLEEYADAAKYFEKARKKIKKSNQVSSYGKLFYTLKEGQTLNYIKLEDFGSFQKSSKKFIDIARIKYSKKSPYFLTTQRVSNEGLYYKNPKAANRKLKRNYKKLIDQVPEYHVSKLPYNNLLFRIKRRNNEFAEAKELMLQNVMIYKENFGETSPVYHTAELRLADFEVNYENDFSAADNIFSKSFDIAITNQLHPYHKDYFEYLILYAQLYELTDRFDLAVDALVKAIAIINLKEGKESKYYGIALEKLAGVYIKKGNFNKAEGLLEKAVDIIKDEAGKKSLAYVNTLRTLAELYSINGRFEDAEKMIKIANRLSKKLGSFVETGNVSNSEELAELYIKTGQYDDAEDILTKTIAIRNVKFGDNHYQLIKPNNLLGRLYLTKGDFVKAEKATKIALNISQIALSDTSTQYLTNLTLLADIYANMGDYKKAEQELEVLLKQNKKIFGADNIAVVEPEIRLAKVKIARKEDPQEIFDLLENSKNIVAKSLNDKHPLFAEILQLQADNKIELKDFGAAEFLLNTSNEIWMEKYGRKSLNTADNVSARAKLYYQKGDFDKAISLYDEALGLYKNIFSEQHPKYVSTQGKLARSYYAKKDYKRSLKLFDETTTQYLDYIKNYFPALSDNEKSKYWGSIRSDFEVFNSLAINFKNEDPTIIAKMYDYKIATKAILLSSSVKVKQRILNSGDEELIAKYKDWIESKELLTRAISMSKEEMASSGINPTQLNKELNTLEKELSEKSEAFGSDEETNDITWENIKDVLKDNETAIEIIRFKYFKTELTDSVLYAALIVNKETKKAPKMVLLSNGNELEKKFFNYYRNTVKYKTQDKYSYKQFWAAIDKEIPKDHKVIISPDGVYNQINVETFQDDNGNYMLDKNVFYIVSNSKDIYVTRIADNKETKKEKKKDGEDVDIFKPTIVLFGNPSFSDENSENTNSVSSVEPLPGAEKEVEGVEGILKKGNWNTTIYLGEDATEGKVKRMESPKVFHVATHGYFIADDNEDESLLASNNPLLKSGLLFTGASELLNDSKESIYNLNKKDGVLTAYEAMNLQLDNTELVVLSACETGLGEIKDGEGVFGLQRAFIVAGAQNVIMSLFKVNDQATQELMDTFYAKWVETGDKRSAFTYAKNYIREKYDAPIYWGSFLMIGLD